MAADIALKEYLQESKLHPKYLLVDKVINGKRQVVGFLNHNLRINFLTVPQGDCKRYSFFCSPPHKCRAEVNVKNNTYSVISIECQPRKGKGKKPEKPEWSW